MKNTSNKRSFVKPVIIFLLILIVGTGVMLLIEYMEGIPFSFDKFISFLPKLMGVCIISTIIYYLRDSIIHKNDT